MVVNPLPDELFFCGGHLYIHALTLSRMQLSVDGMKLSSIDVTWRNAFWREGRTGGGRWVHLNVRLGADSLTEKGIR